MPPLRILETPELHEPTLIAAFAGWSDAGGAATSAAQYLAERWRAPRIAEIEAEGFYDFTQLRPTVRYVDETRRRIDWPENFFSVHQTPERDLIILNGIEPHLHWKTYVDSVLDVIQRFDVKLVVTLGALFVEYPHTRPMRITGTAPDPEMQERAGLFQRGGRYEGPTGISGVLNVALRDREVPAATIWANVPHYVSASPNPRATLGLLRSLTSMLEVEVPLRRMERASEAFDTQLNEATEKNSEVSEYVRSLEERIDAELDGTSGDGPQAELPATDTIVKDIEDFLRGSSREEP
ncbi:MAG: PAC2 family protein [Dehalococcoidia bacterium]|nr:PAC2 family protein [Dehalococcoidia bacterium]